eukprot:SAG11_NODE_17316_length_521_cov_58.800948_1_plen_74_part_01
MVRLHSEEPTRKKQALVSAPHALTGLRHDALQGVHDNLVHCHEMGVKWDPSARYCKNGSNFGPTARAEASPGAA